MTGRRPLRFMERLALISLCVTAGTALTWALLDWDWLLDIASWGAAETAVLYASDRFPEWLARKTDQP